MQVQLSESMHLLYINLLRSCWTGWQTAGLTYILPCGMPNFTLPLKILVRELPSCPLVSASTGFHYIAHVHPYPFRNPADLPPRRTGSAVQPQLRFHDGFACRECSYLTVSYKEVSRHVSRAHLGGLQASRHRVDGFYDDVYLQTWTHGAMSLRQQSNY